MKAKLTILIGLFLASQTTTLFAYPGESVVRDSNGDYNITYWNGANIMHSKFYPATKIEPGVNSSFNLSAKDLIIYRYTISNGATAKQPITSVTIKNITHVYGSKPMIEITSQTTPQEGIAAVQAMSAPLAKPNKWVGAADQDPSNASALQAGWFYSPDDDVNVLRMGVMPGNVVRGFGFSSFDLPGIGNAQLQGEVNEHGVYEDEGPSPGESAIVPQLDQIEQNDFIARPVAEPLISVPAPFVASVVLDRIRTHIATWPGKQLLDSTFAAQLDRYLVAAANAYRLNNFKAGREQIESVRKLLAHEHNYLDHDDEDNDDTPEHKAATRLTIDRLAARVLDFDLRYVLKRMGNAREHDHDDGEKGK
jgi:hypothetical protein